MFKGAKKEDLRIIAVELGETLTDKLTVLELTNVIKNNEKYTENPEQITELLNDIIENRKVDEKTELELEKVKLEKTKAELELLRLRAELQTAKAIEIDSKVVCYDSLDSLIKSIRTLTIKVPSRPEGWGFFFSTLERAFLTKNVPEKFKAEILLNLLGEKSSNVIIYIKDDELSDYDKVKSIVLREFEPTAQSCLENFGKASRQMNETHVQFASRLSTSFDYYLKLRKVTDFEALKNLVVSDKLCRTLDKETVSHISVRQGDSWFQPIELGKEIDLYFTSRGKSLAANEITYHNNTNMKKVSKVFLSEMKGYKCIMCSENHPLYKCSNYKALSVNHRIEAVKKNKLCFNCLSGLHKVMSCRSKYSCSLCKRRHHISLHFLSEQDSTERNVHENINTSALFQSREGENEAATAAAGLSPLARTFNPSGNGATYSINPDVFTATSYVSNCSKTVLLSTAIIYVADEFGNNHPVRGLLDVGSQSNFVTNDCVNRLGLKRNKINLMVSGLNDLSMTIRSRVNTIITNRERDFKKELDLLVVPRITDFTPGKPLNVRFQDVNYVQLADENFNVPGRIDVLLGAEIFYELLRPGQIYPNPKILLQNTVFGYIVSGSITNSIDREQSYCGVVTELEDLSSEVRKFWEIEHIQEIEKCKGEEESECNKHFIKTHKRDDSGRFIVQMPLKKEPCALGESKQIAIKRLNSVWNRLNKNPELLKLYKQFMTEYEELGHMTEVNEANEPKVANYLPHHAVYRPDKCSTKLRVVFNGSHVTSSGESLNSLQLNGGVIQDDLFSIILRFRTYCFAFTADVKMMYRMINIDESQRDLQRIVWKKNLNDSAKTYKLATVTYGTTSAPYLAMRCLKQLGIDGEKQFPAASVIVQSDFYMDDVLTGASDLERAKKLQKELVELLNTCGMQLHKWCSNHPEMMANVPQPNNYIFDKTNPTKTLGLVWNAESDVFAFNFDCKEQIKITKREVLSTIARIFDPLGLIAPVVTKAKIFLQRLWRLKTEWDDLLPQREAAEWMQFCDSLKKVHSISVSRYVLLNNTLVQTSLVGFSDASESAYGAVIYVVCSTASGEFSSHLLCSKSRVAPIKTVTIPRLELCAAVLLAKLMCKVISVLNISKFSTYYYSDSTIVLSWIRKSPSDLKTFVATRVATIQELTKVEHWRHVSSEENSADLISRGMDPEKLLQSKLWFNGPEFLAQDECPNSGNDQIPLAGIKDYNNELKHRDASDFNTCLHVLTSSMQTFVNELLNISNKYNKIIRMFSFICRFIENCRSDIKKVGYLGPEELKHAELTLVKLVQHDVFKKEIANLQKTGMVSADSHVKNLKPFIDEEGIMRVGGRLENSNLSFDRKYPIVLPSKHKLTELIIEYYHQKYLHLGPQALLYQVRQMFWPINGRDTCRKIVHKCIVCFKSKPVICQQIMGNLPKERVNENFPFNCTGVDFCGPFWIKYKHQRKGTYQKIYVAIFVCFVTRAVHLEIVTDLTSQAFIATLKRFFARRGKSSDLFSDNAKNFVGSNLELKRLYNMVNKPDEILAGYLSSERVNWKFIPPRAPNFGGLWEAGVKSFKYHLKRVVGKTKLTYEEFLTVTTQIEGILNSRPLTPLTTDINDLEALTPGHFLIGRPITSIVEPNFTHIENNRLKVYQKVTKIVQTVWKNWSHNYLSSLQQRSKWFFEKDNVKIGDLVLIKEDDMAICNWQLGRLTEVFPGKDNKVRVVNVKSKHGVFKRPISKICILPLEK